MNHCLVKVVCMLYHRLCATLHTRLPHKCGIQCLMILERVLMMCPPSRSLYSLEGEDRGRDERELADTVEMAKMPKSAGVSVEGGEELASCVGSQHCMWLWTV